MRINKKKLSVWIIIFSLVPVLLAVWAVYTDVIILRKTEDMANYENTVSILWVGSSHVFAGNVPQQLQAVTESYDIKITYKDISRHGNRGGTLREHRENAIKEMQTGKFDYVVLHDQSRRSLNDIDGLLSDIQILCETARENSVIPILYDFACMAADGQPDEERLRASISAYKHAAAENDAILVRAAESWIYAYKTIPEISLYTRFDLRGLHSNKAGGFLTACVFATTLFNLHIEEVPKDSIYKGNDALDLAQAAWEFVHSSH
ncbi:MAG: hypothetical protein FWG36_04140 [Oscillospiraceae bacterium]|nr:hypothetical protein [Oscillospiraceae bacterium]